LFLDELEKDEEIKQAAYEYDNRLLAEQIIKKFEFTINARRTFINNCSIIDNLNKKILNFNYDPKFEFKKRKSYFIDNSLELIKEIKKEENIVPIFFTLTLPSKYHLYSIKKRRKLDHLQEDFEESYSKLKDIYYHITNRFKVGGKAYRLRFIRVYEPHKNLTPHIHSIIFIDKKYIGKFLRYIRTITKNNGIRQYDFTVLDKKKDLRISLNYLLKYVEKSLDDDFYPAWCNFFKITRPFLSSKATRAKDITFSIYKKVMKDVSFDKVKEYKSENLLDYIINHTRIERKIIDKDKKKVNKDIVKDAEKEEHYFIKLYEEIVYNSDFKIDEANLVNFYDEIDRRETKGHRRIELFIFAKKFNTFEFDDNYAHSLIIYDNRCFEFSMFNNKENKNKPFKILTSKLVDYVSDTLIKFD